MNIKLVFIPFIIAICLYSKISAQTISTIASGGYYTALAYDASGNLYTTRYDATSDRYQVVKYINGTGSPQVLLGGLQYTSVDYPWGIAVAGNGDVYIAASNVDNRIIKLPYNSGSGAYGTAETFISDNYYSALAIDSADNLYTLEYAPASGDYAIVRYPAGSSAGIQLYHGLAIGGGYQYPTGLAIASNGDIYTTDGFDDGTNNAGAIYRFTAASGYINRIAISSGKFSSSLALDPNGNLYAAEYNGSTYVLNRYNNGLGSPVQIQELELEGNFYPWGIIALNSTNIYFVTGNGGSGGTLKHLLDMPEIPASNISFTNTTDSSTTISWAKGSGVYRSVFMTVGNSGIAAPVNGAVYTGNAIFGSGSQIGSSGWYCVYAGTGDSVSVTGLSAITTYRVMVVEDNGNMYYQPNSGINNPSNITTTEALPVTFGVVSALLENGILKVNWSTESETNNDFFAVEASVDGKHFEQIGTISSQGADGNSDQVLYYQFEKAANTLGLILLPFIIGFLNISKKGYRNNILLGIVLLMLLTGVYSCIKKDTIAMKGIEKLYIRIAQVDKDGTTKYSKTVLTVQK